MLAATVWNWNYGPSQHTGGGGFQRERGLVEVKTPTPTPRVQLGVITGGPLPLEPTGVHQHLHELKAGERPPPYRSVQNVWRVLLAGDVVGGINARRLEFLAGRCTVTLTVVRRHSVVEVLSRCRSGFALCRNPCLYVFCNPPVVLLPETDFAVVTVTVLSRTGHRSRCWATVCITAVGTVISVSEAERVTGRSS